MKKERKPKSFLKKPTYKGGKKALDLFIKGNLKYPEEALKNKIEGGVLIGYIVNDDGAVVEAEILKSLGYGCDEEALRLVKLLSYPKVRNRGVISTFNMKINIKFKLPKQQVSQNLKLTYNIVETGQKSKVVEEKPKPNSYTITVNIPSKN